MDLERIAYIAVPVVLIAIVVLAIVLGPKKASTPMRRKARAPIRKRRA